MIKIQKVIEWNFQIYFYDYGFIIYDTVHSCRWLQTFRMSTLQSVVGYIYTLKKSNSITIY
jgi:hypothetical protein